MLDRFYLLLTFKNNVFWHHPRATNTGLFCHYNLVGYIRCFKILKLYWQRIKRNYKFLAILTKSSTIWNGSVFPPERTSLGYILVLNWVFLQSPHDNFISRFSFKLSLLTGDSHVYYFPKSKASFTELLQLASITIYFHPPLPFVC